MSDDKAVLYTGNRPLNVSIETLMEAIEALLTVKEAFLEKCEKELPAGKEYVVIQPELVNLAKKAIEAHSLFVSHGATMDIMKSKKGRKSCFEQ